jgi:hypothetical protein
MPLVATVDYPTRRIYLTAQALVGDFDTLEVYREVRALRKATEEHRKFRPMIVGGGNIQKTATSFTQAYVQLLNGCRIVPANVGGRIRLVRDTFTDDGAVGEACFDRTNISSNVDIDVAVLAVEIRTVSGSGASSGLTTEQAAKLDELWKLAGLDPASPMTVTPTGRLAGGINQAITGDGESTTTVQRL